MLIRTATISCRLVTRGNFYPVVHLFKLLTLKIRASKSVLLPMKDLRKGLMPLFSSMEGQPVRVIVTSCSWSGANAHVLLEEFLTGGGGQGRGDGRGGGRSRWGGFT